MQKEESKVAIQDWGRCQSPTKTPNAGVRRSQRPTQMTMFLYLQVHPPTSSVSLETRIFILGGGGREAQVSPGPVQDA